MKSSDYNTLSMQEWKVVDTACTGRAPKATADYLCRSIRTVTVQAQSIYDKTELPRHWGALTKWASCLKNNEELPEYLKDAGVTTKGVVMPEFMRKTGGVLLLMLIIGAEYANFDTLKTSRLKTVRSSIHRGGRGKRNDNTPLLQF